jgi:hypothetical protein
VAFKRLSDALPCSSFLSTLVRPRMRGFLDGYTRRVLGQGNHSSWRDGPPYFTSQDVCQRPTSSNRTGPIERGRIVPNFIHGRCSLLENSRVYSSPLHPSPNVCYIRAVVIIMYPFVLLHSCCTKINTIIGIV